MTSRLARALAALLHEHADLGAARLAVHDAQHLRVGHERRPGEDFTALLFQHQNLIDADFGAGLGIDPSVVRAVTTRSTGIFSRFAASE